MRHDDMDALFSATVTSPLRRKFYLQGKEKPLRKRKMEITRVYTKLALQRAEVDAWDGFALLEFGAPRCGYCCAVQPLLESALAGRADIRHIKIEDGKGLPLGRSYKIKLWPTLIFLKDGIEIARLVRPPNIALIAQALDAMGNTLKSQH